MTIQPLSNISSSAEHNILILSQVSTPAQCLYVASGDQRRHSGVPSCPTGMDREVQ